MSSEADELIRVYDALPEEKRVELVDFAELLLQRSWDERWEQIIADVRPRPKLEAFVRAALDEGSGPLEPGLL
jgi:hypothetical protein